MKTNKLSYEEQVLKIGNGKMLEPGFYNADLEKVEDINGFLKSRTPNEKTDSIRYAIFEKDDTSIRSEKCYNLRNMCAVVLPQNLKTIEEEAFSFLSLIHIFTAITNRLQNIRKSWKRLVQQANSNHQRNSRKSWIPFMVFTRLMLLPDLERQP